MKGLAASLLLTIAACTSASPPPPVNDGMVHTIRYETGPCLGYCPVYVVTVSIDGHGVFEGRRFTAATGTHSFTVTPGQFAEFRRRLEPYRPAGEAKPSCNDAVTTDQDSVDITWTGKNLRSHFSAYYGCDMERNAAMFKALKEAPQALPIQAFIGTN